MLYFMHVSRLIGVKFNVAYALFEFFIKCVCVHIVQLLELFTFIREFELTASAIHIKRYPNEKEPPRLFLRYNALKSNKKT